MNSSKHLSVPLMPKLTKINLCFFPLPRIQFFLFFSAAAAVFLAAAACFLLFLRSSSHFLSSNGFLFLGRSSFLSHFSALCFSKSANCWFPQRLQLCFWSLSSTSRVAVCGARWTSCSRLLMEMISTVAWMFADFWFVIGSILSHSKSVSWGVPNVRKRLRRLRRKSEIEK